MCLGLPGRVVEVGPLDGSGLIEGTVDFGGVRRHVNLSFTPEVTVGDYVVVHVGFAISLMDEAEARITLDSLTQLDRFGELHDEARAAEPAGRDENRAGNRP
jgi:hydrogenase expression/formation protein HypC